LLSSSLLISDEDWPADFRWHQLPSEADTKAFEPKCEQFPKRPYENLIDYRRFDVYRVMINLRTCGKLPSVRRRRHCPGNAWTVLPIWTWGAQRAISEAVVLFVQNDHL
jgi:hypothetical protein